MDVNMASSTTGHAKASSSQGRPSSCGNSSEQEERNGASAVFDLVFRKKMIERIFLVLQEWNSKGKGNELAAEVRNGSANGEALTPPTQSPHWRTALILELHICKQSESKEEYLEKGERIIQRLQAQGHSMFQNGKHNQHDKKSSEQSIKSSPGEFQANGKNSSEIEMINERGGSLPLSNMANSGNNLHGFMEHFPSYYSSGNMTTGNEASMYQPTTMLGAGVGGSPNMMPVFQRGTQPMTSTPHPQHVPALNSFQDFYLYMQQLGKDHLIQLLWKQKEKLVMQQYQISNYHRNYEQLYAMYWQEQGRQALMPPGSATVGSDPVSAPRSIKTNSWISSTQDEYENQNQSDVKTNADQYWRRIMELRDKYMDCILLTYEHLTPSTAGPDTGKWVRRNLDIASRVLNETPTNQQPRKIEELDRIEKFMAGVIIPILSKVGLHKSKGTKRNAEDTINQTLRQGRPQHPPVKIPKTSKATSSTNYAQRLSKEKNALDDLNLTGIPEVDPSLTFFNGPADAQGEFYDFGAFSRDFDKENAAQMNHPQGR